MSTLRPSGLRRSRLTNASSQDGLKTKPSLAEFTKASHKQLLLAREANRRHQNNASNIQDAIIDAASDENKKDDVTMAQCISLLDPHMAVFRDRCDAAAAKQKPSKPDHTTTTDDMEDEVPPQLLRLARFFAWRWLPIKKALLRPFNSQEQEVEISLTHRLRMAKACWKKGLLATAEYESLSASFECRKRGADDLVVGGKRHKPHNLMERVRLALMHLPTEIVTNERAMLAWRHVNEMLLEFCKSRKSTDEIEQVTEWTLTSWTALVLSQGMNASSTSTLSENASKNVLPAIESEFAQVLSNCDANSGTFVIAQVATVRLDELLTPNSLKSLNGHHIFSLGRLFARFQSTEIAEERIAKSILHCSAVGGMTCMEQLSRLVATYACSLSTARNERLNNKEHQSADLISELEKSLFAKLESGASAELRLDPRHAKKAPADGNGVQSYLKVVLNASAHLCRRPQLE